LNRPIRHMSNYQLTLVTPNRFSERFQTHDLGTISG
jgi:hypothetical protein